MPADASGAVVTVTVTQPQHAGYLTVNGITGRSRSSASTLNFQAGQDVANSVTALLADPLYSAQQQVQSICAFSTASTHLLVDVTAVYSESAGTGMLVPLTPARVDDTRAGARVPVGTVHEVAVAGRGGVPADATAVAVNLTVIDPGVAGYATRSPAVRACPRRRTRTSSPARPLPLAPW